MTQRVARPMKFAAFISIIVSVAVMFVACQGAVGPKGDPGADGKDGADGADGATGPQGPQGLPGAAALTVRQGVNLTVSINDGKDQQGAAIVGSTAATRDMSSFFRGRHG